MMAVNYLSNAGGNELAGVLAQSLLDRAIGTAR